MPETNRPTVAEVRAMIRQLVGGRIFRVEFTKADGSHRVMRCRLGVRKHTTGEGRAWSAKNLGYLSVWDTDKRDYRLVKLETIERIVCGKVDVRIPRD